MALPSSNFSSSRSSAFRIFFLGFSDLEPSGEVYSIDFGYTSWFFQTKKISHQNQSKNFLPKFKKSQHWKNNYAHLNLLGFLKTIRWVRVNFYSHCTALHLPLSLCSTQHFNVLLEFFPSNFGFTKRDAEYAVICLHFFTADMSIYAKFRAGRYLFP